MAEVPEHAKSCLKNTILPSIQSALILDLRAIRGEHEILGKNGTEPFAQNFANAGSDNNSAYERAICMKSIAVACRGGGIVRKSSRFRGGRGRWNIADLLTQIL